MKVLIVGAGMGGLTLAAFLRHSTIEYEIVEKAPDWTKQGFLVGIWDNGRDILKKLGLAEDFDTAGERVKSFSIRNGKGQILREQSFGHLYSSYGGAQTIIARSTLHELLLSEVEAGTIRLGMSVESLQQTDTGVLAKLTNGEERTYDVVVGADGVHSKVRALSFGDHLESYIGWRSWYCWIEPSMNRAGTITEYIEPGQFVMVTGTKDRTLATFMAPADHTTWDEEATRMDMLKTVFKDESALVPKVLENHTASEILPTDLAEVELSAWSLGRIVLIGDAAHSFGPFAGMGCSMAMEDAYVLSSHLMRVSSSYPLQEAFRDYERAQKRRVSLLLSLSRRIKMAVLVKSSLWRRALNAIIPIAPESLMVKEYETLLASDR